MSIGLKLIQSRAGFILALHKICPQKLLSIILLNLQKLPIFNGILRLYFNLPIPTLFYQLLWFIDEIKLMLQEINGSNKYSNYILLIKLR